MQNGPRIIFLLKMNMVIFAMLVPVGWSLCLTFRMLPTDIHKMLSFWFEGFTFWWSYEILSCHKSSEFSTSAVHTT